MNYYQARERTDKDGKPSGLWHYTRMNDGHVWPVGYCANDCPGHENRFDAYEHYRQYLLDTARFEDGTLKDTQHVCEIETCSTYTNIVTLTLDNDHHFLCDLHRNREGLAEILIVGDSISSW